MKNVFVFMFALLCLISCSKHNNFPPISCQLPEKEKIVNNIEIIKTIYIDSRFNASEKLAIITAKNEWQNSTKEIIKFNLIFDFKINLEDKIPKKTVLMKLNSSDNIVNKLDEEIGEDFISGTMISPNVELILVVPDRVKNTSELKKNMMKELGHSLGLPTIKEEIYPAIMNEFTPDVDCLTKYDLTLFCAKYLCNAKELNYCDFKSKNRINKL